MTAPSGVDFRLNGDLSSSGTWPWSTPNGRGAMRGRAFVPAPARSARSLTGFGRSCLPGSQREESPRGEEASRCGSERERRIRRGAFLGPGSQREESPRGEEASRCGSESERGTRRAVEAASGRAARRCADRAQVRSERERRIRRAAFLGPGSQREESPRGEEASRCGSESERGTRRAVEAASGRAARPCADRAQVRSERERRSWQLRRSVGKWVRRRP